MAATARHRKHSHHRKSHQKHKKGRSKKPNMGVLPDISEENLDKSKDQFFNDNSDSENDDDDDDDDDDEDQGLVFSAAANLINYETFKNSKPEEFKIPIAEESLIFESYQDNSANSNYSNNPVLACRSNEFLSEPETNLSWKSYLQDCKLSVCENSSPDDFKIPVLEESNSLKFPDLNSVDSKL